jgi:hypothetical protein
VAARTAALCSGALAKPIQQQMVILGSMSLGGNFVPVENLAESLQVAFDAGAKRILLPMASVKDIPTIRASCSRNSRPGSTRTPGMRCLRLSASAKRLLIGKAKWGYEPGKP